MGDADVSAAIEGGGGSDRGITIPRDPSVEAIALPDIFPSRDMARRPRRARPQRVAYSCVLCGGGGIRSSWGRPRKYCGNCAPLALAAARAAYQRRVRDAGRAEKGGENVPNTLGRSVSQSW